MEITIKNKSDYGSFFKLCHEDLSDINNEITIQYNKGFLYPSDILHICQFAIIIINKNPNIKIGFKANNNLKEYVTDIGLSEFLRTNYKQPRTIDFITKLSAMPIRRVGQEYIDEYVLKTVFYLGNICKGKDLTVLYSGISESINNVHDHAKSAIGAYVFCQFYPTVKTIRLCVSDLGDGIPNVVRKEFPDYDDNKCLQWALEENNTTKSRPNNAGKGLAIIRSFTRKTNGELRITTGSCYYRMKDGKENFWKNNISSFKGTIIEININIEELEDDDHENVDGSF